MSWTCPRTRPMSPHFQGHGVVPGQCGFRLVESCVWRTCPHIWVMSGWDYRNFQCRSTVKNIKVVTNMNIKHIVLQFIDLISFIDNYMSYSYIRMKMIMALSIVSRNVLWTQDTRTFTCPISEQKHWCPRNITRGHLRTCPDMSRTGHLRFLFEKKSDMSLKDISI